MMHEEMLDGRDERDAYRLAVGQELQDDNRSEIFLMYFKYFLLSQIFSCFSKIFMFLKYVVSRISLCFSNIFMFLKYFYVSQISIFMFLKYCYVSGRLPAR